MTSFLVGYADDVTAIITARNAELAQLMLRICKEYLQ